MPRYAIKNSSIFDNPDTKYRTDEYRRILEAAGAKTFVTRLHGWSNQPEILGFTGIEDTEAQKLLGNLPEFATFGPIIIVVYW